MNHIEIVEMCSKGDSMGFALLYRQYYVNMYRLVKLYILNTDDVEDVLHDGFIVAFEKIRQLRNPVKIESWLSSIMRNTALGYINGRKSADWLQVDCCQDVVFEEIDMQSMVQQDVMSIFDSLPSIHKTVLQLYVMEDKSHREISNMLNISLSAAVTRLSRAKALLRARVCSKCTLATS